MPSPIVGTWHANGFYGNFRSRCRSDFTQEYRKAAQPQPPDLFLRRMKGLGRRRIEGSLPNTHNLIDWIPLKEELQRERPLVSSYQSDFRSREKVPQVLVHHSHQSLRGQPLYRTPSTTYQRTYRSYCLREPSLGALKEQEVVKEATPLQPTSSEPAPPPSSEPMALTASEPTRADASTTTREADVPFYGRSVHKPTRLTVSDCLRWHSC
ncbi:uncharacterized protein C3orf84 homolog isoform X2 [Hemicordylus capensis]|uniref:uncharacterized protein C3orf84 homolog isoform X2 n=1 Tax=Hemicordylus capensis TaxID=884348 RepID=UPI002303E7C4|nr:uncharacterized protein C3orf84 homolog isoform X2 [Hemicordylus capensis]